MTISPVLIGNSKLDSLYTDVECKEINQSNQAIEPTQNDANNSKRLRKLPDGGFGWVIVTASLLASMIGDGVSYSYGVLATEYIKEYNISHSLVGFMGALLIAITLGTGPLVSCICHKLGYRMTGIIGGIIAGVSFGLPYFYSSLWFLILTSCITCGFGLGMVYLPSVVIINEWFDSKKPIAMGIALCGSGLGAFVFSPIMEQLLLHFGWKMTMLIMGGVILLIAPICAFYVVPDNETETIDIKEEDIRDSEDCSNEAKNSSTANIILTLLNNKIFILFAISNVLTNIAFNAPTMFIKDRGLRMGFSSNKSSFLISTMGIGNCFGRVLFGLLGTTRICNRFHMYCQSLIVAGLCLIFSFFLTLYPACVFYTIVYGLFAGAYVTLTPVLIVDMFSRQGLSMAFGLINIFQAVGVICGPSLIGCIFDLTKSYDIAFSVSGVFILISGLVLYLAYASRLFRKINFRSNSSDRQKRENLDI